MRNSAAKNKEEGKKNNPIKKNLWPTFIEVKSFDSNIFFKDMSKLTSKTLPAGFEPAAHCLEGSCSIQLS